MANCIFNTCIAWNYWAISFYINLKLYTIKLNIMKKRVKEILMELIRNQFDDENTPRYRCEQLLEVVKQLAWEDEFKEMNNDMLVQYKDHQMEDFYKLKDDDLFKTRL